MNFLITPFAKNERNFLFQKVEADDIFFFSKKFFMPNMVKHFH